MKWKKYIGKKVKARLCFELEDFTQEEWVDGLIALDEHSSHIHLLHNNENWHGGNNTNLLRNSDYTCEWVIWWPDIGDDDRMFCREVRTHDPIKPTMDIKKHKMI